MSHKKREFLFAQLGQNQKFFHSLCAQREQTMKVSDIEGENGKHFCANFIFLR